MNFDNLILNDPMTRLYRFMPFFYFAFLTLTVFTIMRELSEWI